MHLEFLLFAIVILASRLIYLTYDTALSQRANAALAGVQGLALLGCFSLNAAALGSLATIIGVALLSGLLERRVDLRNGFRLVTLTLLLLIPAGLDAQGQGLLLRPWLIEAAAQLPAVLPLTAGGSPDWQPPLLFLFGILLLANEANIVVRAVFHHCRLEPRQEPALVAVAVPVDTVTERSDPPPRPDGHEAPEVPGAAALPATGSTAAVASIDQQEYNAGRVIGFLERWLMFLVIVMSGDFNALAFIIAAKGLARMKQLEDRQFAEYMLIGTFLSALCAMLVALFVRRAL